MYINPFGTSATNASGRTGKLRPGGKEGNFAAGLSDNEETTTRETTGSTASAGIGSLLLLQEDDEERKNRTIATVRAETLLEQLDEMRLALLTGSLSESRLRAMQKLVAGRRPAVQDSHLNGLLDDIELRVMVELAKRGL